MLGKIETKWIQHKTAYRSPKTTTIPYTNKKNRI